VGRWVKNVERNNEMAYLTRILQFQVLKNARFRRFLHFRDFLYYDTSLMYMELVSGYEVNTLIMRRDICAMKHL